MNPVRRMCASLIQSRHCACWLPSTCLLDCARGGSSLQTRIPAETRRGPPGALSPFLVVILSSLLWARGAGREPLSGSECRGAPQARDPVSTGVLAGSRKRVRYNLASGTRLTFLSTSKYRPGHRPSRKRFAGQAGVREVQSAAPRTPLS